jgi:hypothetical protein
VARPEEAAAAFLASQTAVAAATAPTVGAGCSAADRGRARLSVAPLVSACCLEEEAGASP